MLGFFPWYPLGRPDRRSFCWDDPSVGPFLDARTGSLVVRGIDDFLTGRSSDKEGGASGMVSTSMGWGWPFGFFPPGMPETFGTGVTSPGVDGSVWIPSLRFSAFHLDLILRVWTHADFSFLAG